MGTILRHDDKDTSMQCRVINVIFHHDFIDGFLSNNNGRSRAIQETGNGSQFQRFWVCITNAINGGESTTNKTLTKKEQPKQQQEESQDSVKYVVLTLDDDSSPQIDSDIDPYGELEERLDDDANKTYKNHVIDAKLNGVNPAVSNTAKVMEKEVESLFKGFLSIWKFMAAAMKTSWSHDSDPMQYMRRVISKSKTTKISTFSAFYFFCKSEKVQDFGFTFSAVLASSLVADSMPGSIANMKGLRSTSPVTTISVPSSKQIADAITSMKEVMAADVKE